MWSALKADFTEFVSTVADDTSNVLSKIDTGMDDDDDDDNNEEEEGNNNNKNNNKNEDDDNGNNDDDEKNNKKNNVVDHTELKEIMKLLRDHPGTYTEDLADEIDEREQVEEFLKTFDINEMTDEISNILDQHEGTVKKHFEELCPTHVSYEDFWKRYFFRCNEKRLYNQLQEETLRAKQARDEAIQNGINTVTNFFGGAVKAVTDTIAPEAGKRGETITAAATTSSSTNNFFGTKGRPPFVMNTAVSESGDDNGSQDDDDEELGWDDDDDDDDFLEDESGINTTTEQIEFTDKVSEEMEEKLKQAIEERDLIQQTVHMQAEQIKTLQDKLSSAAGGGGSDGGGKNSSKNDSARNTAELEEIKLKLFEKDAELAALKARVHDDDMESGEDDTVSSLIKALQKLPTEELAALKGAVFGAEEPKDDSGEAEMISSLEHEIQQLKTNITAKEEACAQANQKLESSIRESEAVRSQLNTEQANAQNANTAMNELEEKLKSTQDKVKSLQAEKESLKMKAQQAQEEASSQVTSLRRERDESQNMVTTLTSQVDGLKQKLQQTEEALKQKEADLDDAKQESATPSTPDSYSTGVKVDTPAFTTPVTTAISHDLADDDVGDDWGDDWD